MAKTYNPEEVSVTTRVDHDLAGQIKQIAAKRRMSRSVFMRELLALGLERYEHQQAILRAVEGVSSPMLVKSA